MDKQIELVAKISETPQACPESSGWTAAEFSETSLPSAIPQEIESAVGWQKAKQCNLFKN